MRLGEVRHPERARGPKPLAGVRVLAVEQMQAMPFGTQLLAHLGADVVKVEPPGRGESGRASRPAVIDRDGTSVGATFLRNNLSKRSVAIDVRSERGRALVLALAKRFDVFAENARAGAMARLGLGYDAVAAANPRIVYASISGFGNLAPSPYDGWSAYAPIAEAMAGTYEPTRREGEPPPVVVAGALGDNAAALYCVIGVLAALRERDRSGRGQHVDVAMYDAMIAMTDMVPFMGSMGEPRQAATAGRTGIVEAYAARDGHFVVAVFREHQFEKLARLVGRPEWLADPRFATREGWAAQRNGPVREALEQWARDRTKLEAARALNEQGIAAGPSHTADDLRADPHVAAHGMLVEVPRPDRDAGAPPMLVAGNPIALSAMADGPIARFPMVGEHTRDVLRAELALDDDALAALETDGVIGRPA
ncbi:MAG: CoA transferase [Myxococcota bacterium]